MSSISPITDLNVRKENTLKISSHFLHFLRAGKAICLFPSHETVN